MRLGSSLAALLLVGGFSFSTASAVLYWDINGDLPGATFVDGIADGDWNASATNWNPLADGTGTPTTWVPGEDAIFSAGNDVGTNPLTSGAFVNISGTQTANSIEIEEGYVAFRGGTAAVGGNNVTIRNGATLEIDAIARVTQSAGGLLVLDGGTIRSTHATNGNSFWTSTGAGIQVSAENGGTVDSSGGAGIALIYSGLLLGEGGTTTNGGAGTLTKVGPGEFRYNGNATDKHRNQTTFAKLVVKEGLFRLGNVSGGNTELGFGAAPTAVLADAITLDGGMIGTSASITTVANRGITVLGDVGSGFNMSAAPMQVNGPISGTGTIHILGSQQLTLNNAGNVNFGGSLNLGASGVVVLSQSMTVKHLLGTGGRVNIGNTNATRVLTVGDDSDFTYGGDITGPASLTKVGAGTMTIEGFDWTNTGGVNINEGAIRFGNSAAGFATTVPVSIAAGALLDMNNVNDTFGALSGAGTVLQDAANLTLGAATGNHTFSGTITGSGIFRKGRELPTGAGDASTQTLSGNNTLGEVRVNAGSLFLNGTNSTGLVNVNGGTFGGSGSVDNHVNVNSGGRISAGAGGGNATFTAPTVTLEAGSAVEARLGAGAGSDVLNVTSAGGLTINGSTVHLTTANGVSNGQYQLIKYNGGYNGSFFNLGLAGQAGFDAVTLIDNIANNSIDVAIVITERNWITAGSGDWSNGANWGAIPTAPNGPGAIANLGVTSPSNPPKTVTIDDADKTVGVLNLNSATGYTIAAAGENKLVLDTWGADGVINVSAGSHEISAPVALNKNTNAAVAGGNTLTLSGIVSGSGGVIKSGPGTLVLSNTNTYTGTNVFNGGVVSVETDLNLGAAPAAATEGSLTFDGGTLRTGASFTALATNRRMLINSGGATLDVLNTDSAAPTTYAGLITGTGTLTKTGPGQLNNTGNSVNFSGNIQVNQGVLAVTAANSLGNPTGSTVVASGAALQTSGTANIAEAITLNGTGIDDAGALRHTGSNKNLSGPITLGSSNVRINADAATLTLSGGISGPGDRNLTIGGAGSVTINTNPLNLGNGTLRKEGTATLSLQTTAHTMGAVDFASGRIVYSATGALGTGVITVGPDATTISANSNLGNLTLANNMVLTSGASLILSPASGTPITTLDFTGTISGPGALVRGRFSGTGAGVTVLSGANTYAGGLSHYSDQLVLNNKAAAGTGTYTIGDPSLGPGAAPTGTFAVSAGQNLTGADAIANPLVINQRFTISGANDLEFSGPATLATTSNIELTVNNTAATILSGAIGGAGHGITKSGAGSLTLRGANSYNGGTTVNAGTLTLDGASATLGAGDVTVNTSGILQIASGVTNAIANSASLILAGGLSGGGFVDLGAGINEVIAGLTLGGTPMAAGTYGSLASSATFKSDEFFAGAGILTVAAVVGLTGDYNNDGKVDAADYVLWRKNNINGQQGYNDWRANFGAMAGSGSAAPAATAGAVPEPASFALLILGVTAAAFGRGRARRTA